MREPSKYRTDMYSSHKCLYTGLDSLRGLARFNKHEVKTVGLRSGETMSRKMILVDVDDWDVDRKTGERLGKFWADVKTGTLYDPKTGRCMTSDQIWMVL